jgi:hypothetical protein
MSISTNQYDIAADEIIEYYSSLGYDLERVNIIDEKTFSPRAIWRWKDSVVHHDIGLTSKYSFPISFWYDKIDEVLLPIKREMKLDSLGIK